MHAVTGLTDMNWTPSVVGRVRGQRQLAGPRPDQDRAGEQVLELGHSHPFAAPARPDTSLRCTITKKISTGMLIRADLAMIAPTACSSGVQNASCHGRGTGRADTARWVQK